MRSELSSLWSNAGGSVPEHWNFVRFEELLLNPKSMSVGVMYPGKHDGAGVPLIRVADVKNGAVVNKPDFCIGETVHHEYRRTCLDGNELLITLVGNPGDCVIVEKYMADWNVARALAVVRLKDPDIRAWLRYVLLSNTAKHIIGARLNTTVQKTLNLKDIRSLPIPIAPLSERKSIVDAATALEDKINLNHQVNQTLEQMAQAIFKSWFVDFEPVKAKIAALEAGGSEDDALLTAMQAIAGSALFATDAADTDAQTQLARLQTEHPEQYATLRATAELFPSAMQESELGGIPEGWGCLALDEIARYQNGLALQKFRPENEDDFLPVVKIAQLRKGYADSDEKASPNIDPKCIIDNGDVVFSWSGSLIVDIWCGGKGALNQHLFKVTSEAYPKWLYLLFTKHHLEEFQRIATDKAVTMGHIKREHLKSAFCAVPQAQLISAVGKLLGSVIDKQIELRLEVVSLSEVRDTLLPKLLSGELSLAVAEEQLADTVEPAHV